MLFEGRIVDSGLRRGRGDLWRTHEVKSQRDEKRGWCSRFTSIYSWPLPNLWHHLQQRSVSGEVKMLQRGWHAHIHSLKCINGDIQNCEIHLNSCDLVASSGLGLMASMGIQERYWVRVNEWMRVFIGNNRKAMGKHGFSCSFQIQLSRTPQRRRTQMLDCGS